MEFDLPERRRRGRNEVPFVERLLRFFDHCDDALHADHRAGGANDQLSHGTDRPNDQVDAGHGGDEVADADFAADRQRPAENQADKDLDTAKNIGSAPKDGFGDDDAVSGFIFIFEQAAKFCVFVFLAVERLNNADSRQVFLNVRRDQRLAVLVFFVNPIDFFKRKNREPENNRADDQRNQRDRRINPPERVDIGRILKYDARDAGEMIGEEAPSFVNIRRCALDQVPSIRLGVKRHG